MEKRVVVTGLGAVTPVGLGKDRLWSSLKDGVSGIAEISKFDAEGFDCTIAAEVKDFVPGDFMDKKEARRMDTFTQYAIAAARMAVEDSRVDLNGLDRSRLGVVLGPDRGIETLENQFRVILEKGPPG